MTKQKGRHLGIVTALAVALVAAVWIVLGIWIGFSAWDGTLDDVWANVNPGQAQIVSSALTGLGLLTSAVLVPFIFQDRIRDLDSAVGEVKQTMETLEMDASARLEKLSTLLNERMAEIERRSADDVDRIGDVLDEIRSAVILSLSDGNIADPKHAKVFSQHLYNDVTSALKKRIAEKRYLHKVTKDYINEASTMSNEYLSRLEEAAIITPGERSLVDRIKKYALKRVNFTVADVNSINLARSEFNGAFGEITTEPAQAGK